MAGLDTVDMEFGGVLMEISLGAATAWQDVDHVDIDTELRIQMRLYEPKGQISSPSSNM